MSSCPKCAPPAKTKSIGSALSQPSLWRVLLSGALIAGAWGSHLARLEPQWPGALLGVAAATMAGLPIVINATRGLLKRSVGVDVLVTLAIVASIAAREYRAAGMVAFIMLLGDFLQSLSADKTERALRELIELAPDVARVRRDGVEQEVPVESLRVGETCLVRPGEKIPVDGEIVGGSAAVDEATITGEALPADKGPGDVVYGGTIALGGALDVRATHVGDDLAIARMSRLVAEAHQNKAPIVRAADRFASWFVPAALAIAAAVGIASGDLHRAIAVMVVACPCALVIGTPAAILAGIGSAARRGILIKGGAHLEALARTTVVALDKTGTLTEGRPSVVAVHPLDGRPAAEVLRLAAVAEKRSDHPVARAIVDAAEAEAGGALPDPESFTADRAHGVSATFDGLELLVGSCAYFDAREVPLGDVALARVAGEEELGRTAVLVAADGVPAGVVSVADAVRQGARDAVASLQRDGAAVIMLTGDNERAARGVAEQLGIETVEASMLPEDKLAHVQRRVAEGDRVAMVGDGVNDAPALAAATVGVAMGAAGSDVAIEAADIALMSDDVSQVHEAIALSRRTLRIIHQNFLFAILFNSAAMALASVAIVGVVGGAVLHQFSSLAVVLNSLRLLRQARSRSAEAAESSSAAGEPAAPRLRSCCASSRDEASE